jgi:hypothetical protein
MVSFVVNVMILLRTHSPSTNYKISSRGFAIMCLFHFHHAPNFRMHFLLDIFSVHHGCKTNFGPAWICAQCKHLHSRSAEIKYLVAGLVTDSLQSIPSIGRSIISVSDTTADSPFTQCVLEVADSSHIRPLRHVHERRGHYIRNSEIRATPKLCQIHRGQPSDWRTSQQFGLDASWHPFRVHPRGTTAIVQTKWVHSNSFEFNPEIKRWKDM